MSTLDDALAYAARGWPVFPLIAKGKTPATKSGFKDASTNAEVLAIQFANRPDANLGLRTGDEARVWALDVDPRHGGDVTLAKLEAAHGPLPKTVRCRTGTGGWHIYFSLPARKLRNRAGLLPGLDIRAEGGYVVLPPSVHPNGETYRWEEDCAPGEIAIAIAPDWLIDFVAAKERPKPKSDERRKKKADDQFRRRAEGYVAAVPSVAEGQRNQAAFKLAGGLRALRGPGGERLDEADILLHVQGWNARCNPPLDDDELQRCVRNSETYGTPPEPKFGEPGGSSLIHASHALDGRKKLIIYASELHKAADECVRILASEDPPVVLQWCRALVLITRPCDGQHPTDTRASARIHTITESGLCDILNQHIQFLVLVKDKSTGDFVEAACDCPLQLARWILARGEWPGIRRLTGLLETPAMLADGRILSARGHDAESGLYLDVKPGQFFDVPAAPTKEDAERVLRDVISPLFAEFPFDTPADRSVLYSALLSSVSRPAFTTLPLHGFTAPSMATGKTLLADGVAVVAHGHTVPAIAQAQNEEETEKRLHSALLDGRRVVLIDNVQRPLGGDTLCSAITGTSVGVRKFRTQEITQVPTWNSIWLATGNNLQFDKDLRSRGLLCRLDPRIEHPEQRTFKIPRLLEHIAQNRAAIVVGLLTILRAFVHAGRPRSGLRPLNRFEGWSDLVRSALTWLGQADPVETMDAIAQSDPETQGLVLLMHGARNKFNGDEFTAADALGAASSGCDGLKEALDVVCPARAGGGHDARRLGRFLQRSQGRVVDGFRLELSRATQGTNRYRILEVTDGGSGGSRGIDPVESRARADVCASDAHTHDEDSDRLPRAIGTLPRLPRLPREDDDEVPPQTPDRGLEAKRTDDFTFDPDATDEDGPPSEYLPRLDNCDAPAVNDA